MTWRWLVMVVEPEGEGVRVVRDNWFLPSCPQLNAGRVVVLGSMLAVVGLVVAGALTTSRLLISLLLLYYHHTFTPTLCQYLPLYHPPTNHSSSPSRSTNPPCASRQNPHYQSKDNCPTQQHYAMFNLTIMRIQIDYSLLFSAISPT